MIPITKVLVGVALGYVVALMYAPTSPPRVRLASTAALALAGGLVGLMSAWVASPSGPIPWGAEVEHVQGKAQFEALLDESKTQPILVEFYADWCAPCRAAAPDLNRLAQEGQRVAVVDAEANLSLMQALEVSAYPTTFVLRDGAIAARTEGYGGIDELRSLLQTPQ